MSKPVGPYSPIARAGGLAFCSGQIGAVEGVLVESFDAQVKQALANLESVLESDGLSLRSVVKTNLFITDMANFSLMNDIYLSKFAAPLPARSCVAVAALPLGAEFEIEAVANVE